MKRLLTLIILVGFAGGAFFSISAMSMNHHQESPMTGKCPLSSLPSSICPGTLAMAIYHVSSYQSSLNSFLYVPIVQVLIAVLFLIAIVYVFRKYIVSIQHLHILLCSWRLRHDSGYSLRNSQGVTRWLSRLVNSPSFN